MNYSPPQLLIAGQWRTGRGDTPVAVRNPATGAKIGRLPGASADDLSDVLASAVDGFNAWRVRPASDRAGVLERGVARMRERAEAIATLLTLEQGKPLAESRFEVMAACELIKWYAEEAKRVYGRLVPSRLPGGKMEVLKQPVGPVLALALELPRDPERAQDRRRAGGRLLGGAEGGGRDARRGGGHGRLFPGGAAAGRAAVGLR